LGDGDGVDAGLGGVSIVFMRSGGWRGEV
jgi:hypothetical protein